MKRLQEVLLASFVALEGAHFYSSRLPSRMTTVSFVDNEKKAAAIRRGIFEASLMTAGLGAIVGGLIRSWLPIIFSIGTIGFMSWLYINDLRDAPLYQDQDQA